MTGKQENQVKRVGLLKNLPQNLWIPVSPIIALRIVMFSLCTGCLTHLKLKRSMPSLNSIEMVYQSLLWLLPSLRESERVCAHACVRERAKNIYSI